MWPQVLLLCWSATPIFAADDHNPWDELRQAFYVRHFSNGDVYEHDVSLDSPPWSNWAPFYRDEKFHQQIFARLDAFLALPAAEVEEQPVLRRAILLRDLWPVFDAQTRTDLAMSEVAQQRQAALRTRLVQIMRRLELTASEVERLPDNYQASVAAKVFPPQFEGSSPEQGFLPPDLFDENGPWVAFGRGPRGIGAQQHEIAADYRSIFVPYIRVSDKRQQTLDYLTQFRKTPQPPPRGTLLALVRRTALPVKSGEIVATNLLESLQLMVVDAPRDRRFKIVLDRAKCIAGRPDLRMLTSTDPIDAYSLEAGGMFTHDPHKYDTDGEMLVFGRYFGRPKTSSLEHCAICHQLTVGTQLFANTGDLPAPAATTWAKQSAAILSIKQNSPAWKMYRDLGK